VGEAELKIGERDVKKERMGWTEGASITAGIPEGKERGAFWRVCLRGPRGLFVTERGKKNNTEQRTESNVLIKRPKDKGGH